ncbi:hypothetical protein ACWNYO_00845 [Candidatus Vidania fulgoroideorum]
MNNFYNFLRTRISEEKKISCNLSEFKISCLFKGTGEAIGNLIRKFLFSCTEGYAVEKIFFKKFNEFSYIPGLDKDLTEIIYKIKNITLRLIKLKKLKINFSFKGPKTFYSINLQNKFCKVFSNKKIFSFNGNKLCFYIKIGSGLGYHNIKKCYNSKKEILIDSYYCPIKKVYFNIDKKNSYENLILGIKTNKSLKPSVAFRKSIFLLKKSFIFSKKKINDNMFLKINKKYFDLETLKYFFNKNIFFYGDIINNNLIGLSQEKKKEIYNILIKKKIL